MTNAILQEMKERKDAKNKDQSEYKTLKEEVDTECKQPRENYRNKKCAEIEVLESIHRYKEMHKKVKELSDHKPRSRGNVCIKDKDGHVLFDDEKIKERWEEYIIELYYGAQGDEPSIETEERGEILLSEGT